MKSFIRRSRVMIAILLAAALREQLVSAPAADEMTLALLRRWNRRMEAEPMSAYRDII